MTDEFSYSSIDTETLERVAEFHGHYCPGMAMGVHAAALAIEIIGKHSDGTEVVALAETDMCGADAVQFLTCCTFGKGNLIHLDHGKNAFTFTRTKDGKTVRIIAKPDGFPRNPEHQDLMAKNRDGTITPEERVRFKELHIQETHRILTLDPRDIYDVFEVDKLVKRKVRNTQSFICDACGESAQIARSREVDGQTVCLACTC